MDTFFVQQENIAELVDTAGCYSLEDRGIEIRKFSLEEFDAVLMNLLRCMILC